LDGGADIEVACAAAMLEMTTRVSSIAIHSIYSSVGAQAGIKASEWGTVVKPPVGILPYLRDDCLRG